MDGNNLLLAILLSAIVFVAWQYFVAAPELKIQKAASSSATMRITSYLPRETAPGNSADSLSSEARLKIATPTLDGSLLLRGAKLDDLRLKQFHIATDPKSPEVTLFQPTRRNASYFAMFGWRPDGQRSLTPELDTEWHLVSGKTLGPGSPIILEWNNGQGLIFRREITVDRDYLFTITDSVQNKSSRSVALSPYAAIVREGEPKAEHSRFVHEGFVGIFDGQLKKASYKDFEKADARPVQLRAAGGWLGITDQYWLSALIPPQQEKFDGVYQATNAQNSDITYDADYSLSSRVIAPGHAINVTHRLFAGAKVYKILRNYEDTEEVPQLDQAIDWGWFQPITKPLFLILEWFNHLVGNFGVAILLLTVTMKALFYPLAHLSFKSSIRMKQIQPQVKDIQERFAADKLRQQKETLELYRREKVRPFAFGCLPMFVQLPVFLSLLTVLYATIEMYHAPFYGWVHDLSAADPTSILNLFGLLPFHISQMIPSFLSIGLWPILWGMTQWIQTSLSPIGSDPMQAKVATFMPVMLVFLYSGLPVGLVIYYTWSNFLTIVQQCFVMRSHGVPIFPRARVQQ